MGWGGGPIAAIPVRWDLKPEGRIPWPSQQGDVPMSNFKLYSLTEAAYRAEIANGKFPLQQKQIYAALVRLGKPTRGCDAVAEAVKAGLQTKQDYAVLAAWYFSDKRRPACVKRGEAQAEPTGPSKPVYAE